MKKIAFTLVSMIALASCSTESAQTENTSVEVINDSTATPATDTTAIPADSVIAAPAADTAVEVK
jgi:hypothetical protein